MIVVFDQLLRTKKSLISISYFQKYARIGFSMTRTFLKIKGQNL